MTWIVFDRSYVLAALQFDRKAYVEAFIALYAAFGPHIDETIGAARTDFRNALEAAGNELDEDTTKLPETCLRHAQAIVEYEIARQMNGVVYEGYTYEWPPPLSALIRAEVYLRMIVETKMQLEVRAAVAPSYKAPRVIDRATPDGEDITTYPHERPWPTGTENRISIPADKRLRVTDGGDILVEDLA